MKFKSSKIKNMNDFIAGILLMAGGLWLMLSKTIIEGRILKSQSQGLIRPDTYIRILGVLVFFLAALMVIRSINFKKEAETKAFVFHGTKEGFLTLVALILFVALLKPLGFMVVTPLLTFFIVCIYMLKETKDQGLTRREMIKKFVVAGVYSIVLVWVVYLLFSKIMLVSLP